MAIDVYEGIPREEIEAERLTSEGKPYNLDHPDGLTISMRYKGEGKSGVNSQGWERSSVKYFKDLQKAHPEYFSKKNAARIKNGQSPHVDARFVQNFPQYKGYENEILIHHHVGKDGQAVAVPQSMHKGSGEIHLYEDELGVTDNARDFSDYCKSVCEKDPEMIGKSSEEFHARYEAEYLSISKENTSSAQPKQKNAISRAAGGNNTVKSNGTSESHDNQRAK